MEKHDVVVVGAGPAGSTAAYHIEGLDVLVVDRSDFPRHKACGGGLMGARDWHLKFANFAAIESELTACPNDSVKVYWNGKYVTDRRFRHLLDQVDRYEFDELLLREALKKDNVRFLRFDLSAIRKSRPGEPGRYVLSDGKREIAADAVVGADGVRSVVARFLGNPPLKRHQFGICLEYDIAGEGGSEHIRFLPGYGGEVGYAWLFRSTGGYNIGVGYIRETDRNLREYLDEFLKEAVGRGWLPKEYRIRRLSGGVIPLKVAKRYAEDSVLLAGDAAGLVKLPTGEGIYYAMKSGRIAGRTLSEGVEGAADRYRRATRLTRWDTFFGPYIPSKRIALPFWALSFGLEKRLKRFGPWKALVDFLARWVMHRRHRKPGSFYRDERFSIEGPGEGE